MKVNAKRVLICDCEHTMAIDADKISSALTSETPFVQTQLCISQLDTFRDAVSTKEPLVVCCTQQAPLFQEVAEEGDIETDLTFVDVRERAGWSEQGATASPKIAALVAEAAIDITPTRTFTLKSEGVTLVYGAGEATIAVAQQLAERLNVTCLLLDPSDTPPPARFDFPIFCGKIRQARGHLGSFEVIVDGFAAADPSSRQILSFGSNADGAVSQCDLILDLSGGSPLFPESQRRDGYRRVDPTNPVAVQRALFDLTDLVGEFEKPRFIKVNTAICAHSRNQITGCTNCLNACPTGALEPAGDHVAVAPAVCDGHGACASVCPTGAIVFDMPSSPALFERLRVLLGTYGTAGGNAPVLLIHDPTYGRDMINILARTGRGLPANVLPFTVPEIPVIGLDFLLTALAYGARQIRVLCGPEIRDSLGALVDHIGIVESILAGLGYDGDRIRLDSEPDPDAFEASLYTEPPVALTKPASHRVLGEKRTTLFQALDHLYSQAPSKSETIALPAGSPFGDVVLDQSKCTLCLACVGACPTAALGDNPETPKLSFTEVNCVQCGLCRATCPEDAIQLTPRLALAPWAKQRRVLKEDDPFACIRCGKPFAARASIERVVEKLTGHSMFASADRLDLIKMCDDCRVMEQFEDKSAPFAAGPRPPTRTTEDDLLERARKDLGMPPKNEG